jgi:hypothetical protein
MEGRMAACEGYECPVFSVLDHADVDRLLVRLRAVHGDGGRPDIAPQLKAAGGDQSINSPGQIYLSPREQTPRVAASSRP